MDNTRLTPDEYPNTQLRFEVRNETEDDIPALLGGGCQADGRCAAAAGCLI
jgi:hypothetical protein